MKHWRFLLMLMLFGMTQACGMTSCSESYSGRSLAAKVRTKELHGCTGEPFRLDLLRAIAQIPDDTLDAQREQVRDWIFAVTLARIAQQVGIGGTFSGTLHEPVLREDALGHLPRMQSGATRSTTMESGEAIVLVEGAETATLKARVAEAIDDEALYAGNTPAKTRVYQYVLKPELATAEVCEMAPLSRADLEGAGHKYRTGVLNTPKDYEQFVAGGVDLLSAQCTDAGLLVKGRLRPRAARAPITVEHIAALTQARTIRYVPLERLGFTLAMRPDRVVIEQRASEIDSLQNPADREAPDVQKVLEWKKKNPNVSTVELYASWKVQKEREGKPGFSLDPHRSPKLALQVLNKFIDALPNMKKVASVLREFGEYQEAKGILDEPTGLDAWSVDADEAKTSLIAIREKLARAKDADVERILYEPIAKKVELEIGGESFSLPVLGKPDGLARAILDIVSNASSQQCARYDGPFRGTATGMTQFFTDLLMKTLGFNWNGASPEQLIEGFQSKTSGAATTVSCEASSLVSTRSWLGIRESTYTRESSGALRFAPVVTRVFSKSSNLGEEHQEFEAEPRSQRFVSWWNDHYGDVAAWEPQYELLNQLMKWSILVQQAIADGNEKCVAALDDVSVKADYRLDSWMAVQKNLTWHGPVDLIPALEDVDVPPGNAECIPLLQSKAFSFCGEEQVWTGGVTGATQAQVKSKPVRPVDTPVHIARWGKDAKVQRKGPERFVFDSIRGAGGELANVKVESSKTKATFVADVHSDVSQRGIMSAWHGKRPIRQIEKSVKWVGKGARVAERRNGLLVAELKTSDVMAGDIEVTLERGPDAEAKITAQNIAKQMDANGGDFMDAVKSVATSTDRVFVLKGDSVLWGFSHGDEPMKFAVMESGGGNRGPPPESDGSFTVGIRDGASGGGRTRPGPVVHVSFMAYDEALVEGAAFPALRSRRTAPRLEALDDAGIKRMADQAVRGKMAPSDLQALCDDLAILRVHRRREGRDVSLIDQQYTRLAITKSRRQSAGKTTESMLEAGETGAAIYAPREYALAASLPPATHPAGDLAPNEKYITRQDELAPQEILPARISVDGIDLVKLRNGTSMDLDYGAVGSPLRLLTTQARPVKVVLPCDDDDKSPLPPCH